MSDVAAAQNVDEAIPATRAMLEAASAFAVLYPRDSPQRDVLGRMITAGQDLLRDLPAGGDMRRLNASGARLVAAALELLPLIKEVIGRV